MLGFICLFIKIIIMSRVALQITDLLADRVTQKFSTHLCVVPLLVHRADGHDTAHARARTPGLLANDEEIMCDCGGGGVRLATHTLCAGVDWR